MIGGTVQRAWLTLFMSGAVLFGWERDAWSMGIMFVGAMCYAWYPFGATSDRKGDAT